MLMRVSTIIDLSDDNKFKILRDGGWEMHGLGDVF
jgi:tRNA A37 threonylcarbamoyladenosine synthetase subunit TsaC/SUA5/YrdC